MNTIIIVISIYEKLRKNRKIWKYVTAINKGVRYKVTIKYVAILQNE